MPEKNPSTKITDLKRLLENEGQRRLTWQDVPSQFRPEGFAWCRDALASSKSSQKYKQILLEAQAAVPLKTPAAVWQVGMPGSVPEEVRQNILAPLQNLPDILEVHTLL